MSDETRAALREVDQRQDRSPAVCVKTGAPTDRATRVRATALAHPERWEATIGSAATAVVARLLRRPTTVVVLAVAEEPWRRWRRLAARTAAVLAFAAVTIIAGAIGGDPGLVALGVLLLAFVTWLRARAWRACWVGLAYKPEKGDIVVTRVHPGFAAEARKLYVDSIRRRP